MLHPKFKAIAYAISFDLKEPEGCDVLEWMKTSAALLIREDMTNDMEQAVAVAARALRGMELRTHDGWEQTCHRMAEVALEAAAPVLAGELIACCSRLLERAEWAEREVVRLRDELGQPVHGGRLDRPSDRRGTHDEATAEGPTRSGETGSMGRSGLPARNFSGGGQS